MRDGVIRNFAKYKNRLLDYLKLKKIDVVGGMCRCFSGAHADNNPSCQVTKDSFHCHACGAAGDIYSAVALIEHISGLKKLYNFVENIFDKIKPIACNTCGGLPDIYKTKGGRYQVYCENCEKATHYYTTEKGAVKRWNLLMGGGC